MSEEDIIIMTRKEIKRIGIIQRLTNKEIKQKQAAEILELSSRQIRRIVKKVNTLGEKGITHQSRGKASSRKIAEETKQKAKKLYKEKYSDFGPSLANEKLAQEGIVISAETLRNWLITEGLWQKQRKRKKHRQWRARKECFGQMIQMDGSHHDWLEGRGKKLVLMAYIDDATNNVFARFYDYEGTIPAMDSFKGYIQQYGIPQSVYLDRHSTYKSTAKPTIEDELNNTRPKSQFERAIEELQVQVIHAHSPQAKGRIERLFKTFQDRLIKEMRLAGIGSKEQANQFLIDYLPEHNRKFGRQPAKDVDLHRSLSAETDPDQSLCIKNKRTIRNDSTITYNNKLYQILEPVTGRQVILEEYVDGSMLIKYDGNSLKFKPIVSIPDETKIVDFDLAKLKKKDISHRDHPMTQPYFKNQTRQGQQACGVST